MQLLIVNLITICKHKDSMHKFSAKTSKQDKAKLEQLLPEYKILVEV